MRPMGHEAPLPQVLRARSRRVRLDPDVPALLVVPELEPERAAPVVLWMHGRTVDKELDPGRYLRWMRAGIGACAVDLPGHGERFDAALQEPGRALDVVLRMLGEVDPLLEALERLGEFDLSRAAIGGASAGGMVALARLCRDHPFRCASVEAASGSWAHQRGRAMFRDRDPAEVERYDPARNLAGWREIPLQMIHARHDEWVALQGQMEFAEGLRRRYRDPSLVDLVVYERTGAPYEHAGFGRMAADAKNRQAAFLRRWLVEEPEHAGKAGGPAPASRASPETPGGDTPGSRFAE